MESGFLHVQLRSKDNYAWCCLHIFFLIFPIQYIHFSGSFIFLYHQKTLLYSNFCQSTSKKRQSNIQGGRICRFRSFSPKSPGSMHGQDPRETIHHAPKASANLGVSIGFHGAHRYLNTQAQTDAGRKTASRGLQCNVKEHIDAWNSNEWMDLWMQPICH
jgi:hypothetical protein